MESVKTRLVENAAESQLILSLFHGADLFGRGFEREGFCVVRACEIGFGFDVRKFSCISGKFDGIIAGTPCQDFSVANRTKRTYHGDGAEMLEEFKRIVFEASPEWFLLENVPTVPDIFINGYFVQRFDLNALECGLRQRRNRHFQFGSKSGKILSVERTRVVTENIERTCLASEGTKKDRRTFADFCELQGLERDFDLPFLSRSQKYKVVGNGVAVPMAQIIARAITDVYRDSSANDVPGVVTLCACNCGRRITGKQKSATSACRKRLERKRKM